MTDYGKLLLDGSSAVVAGDGGEFRVRTDFRVILRLLRNAENGGNLADGAELFFIDSVPDNAEELMADFIGREYLPCENSAFSFYGDAGLIIGAFMQCYGIDLSSARLHWHVFTALFMSLDGGCAFSQLIKCRCADRADPKNRIKARRIADKYPVRREKELI